ncbi:hypothetical protein OE88DRAFT_1668231 [Heliocybe sulcata]|uniref:Uncharacterized protein n=1 Tax=Heliocybe sulcata TaxID=5364 RepID=A0A5C3MX94_9AGAM|nr:hypothetical protein OE88DRAFT_1668231 [Heliocybe sulcata]
MEEKDKKVEEEVRWLVQNKIHCVLSDAAFLGCLAANGACIPSVLITNFTFDSVYSFLSTSIQECTSSDSTLHATPSDVVPPGAPLPQDLIAPLVDQIHQGYRCADLLLLLPGKIPIPSFFTEPSLPSPNWVDPAVRAFYPSITQALSSLNSIPLLPCIPFPKAEKPLPRSARQTPLLVRTPGSTIYEASGREALLSSIGIPHHLRDPEKTKILVVSFGGQSFKKPRSRASSRTSTPSSVSPAPSKRASIAHELPGEPVGAHTQAVALDVLDRELKNLKIVERKQAGSGRLATPSHIHIPGAPPVYKPLPTPPPSEVRSPPVLRTIPSTPPGLSREHSKNPYFDGSLYDIKEEHIPRMLPDDSWTVVVCGVSPEWAKEDGGELPEGFYVAPRDVWMPDLMAVSDVLLGKLGYGAVSESVESCTPFVYVSRPLFIEEHGLRLFLSESGVGVELSRSSYEEGDWAAAVEEAWLKGKDAKARRRRLGEQETRRRIEEGNQMACQLLDWVEEWETASKLKA